MKTKYTIGLLLLLITTALIAQNKKAATYRINAFIDYEQIAEINVTIIGNDKLYQIFTDSNGYFCLESLENGTYTVIINIEGEAKRYFDFSINNNNKEAYFEIYNNYPLISRCPSFRGTTITIIRYSQNSVRAPNQQIEALAAYTRGVDYRYSNTINFGNSNEITIGK